MKASLNQWISDNFRLINRARSTENVVDWSLLGDYSPYETFKNLFYGTNVGKESYFDQMTILLQDYSLHSFKWRIA